MYLPLSVTTESFLGRVRVFLTSAGAQLFKEGCIAAVAASGKSCRLYGEIELPISSVSKSCNGHDPEHSRHLQPGAL